MKITSIDGVDEAYEVFQQGDSKEIDELCLRIGEKTTTNKGACLDVYNLAPLPATFQDQEAKLVGRVGNKFLIKRMAQKLNENRFFLDYYFCNNKDNITSMCWAWGPYLDEMIVCPRNYHRQVYNSYRGFKLSTIMLSIAEQQLQQLGFKQVEAESSKPSSITWFFHHGYVPVDPTNITYEQTALLLKPINYQLHMDEMILVKNI